MGQAPRRRGLHPLGPGKIPLPGLRSFRRGSSPEKGTLPFACSVASALATARGRYHLFPGGGRGVTRLDERPGFSPSFWGWRKRRGACRGGGGAKRPHRKGGGLWPPPLRRFCGPWARKTPPPRRGRPAFLRPQAPPYCRWMQAGDGGGGRRGVRAGAAAFGGRGRPAGLPPACQTKERARGPWPRVRSFRALRAPPPPPRALGFCTAAPAGKAGREARAFCRPWNGGCRARVLPSCFLMAKGAAP